RAIVRANVSDAARFGRIDRSRSDRRIRRHERCRDPTASSPDNVAIRLRVVEPRRLAVLARRSGAIVASLSARAWHPHPVNAYLAPIAQGADHDCRPHWSLLATSLFFRELSVPTARSLFGRSSCRVAGPLSHSVATTTDRSLGLRSRTARPRQGRSASRQVYRL